jgi:hypothetical protein
MYIWHILDFVEESLKKTNTKLKNSLAEESGQHLAAINIEVDQMPVGLT